MKILKNLIIGNVESLYIFKIQNNSHVCSRKTGIYRLRKRLKFSLSLINVSIAQISILSNITIHVILQFIYLIIFEVNSMYLEIFSDHLKEWFHALYLFHEIIRFDKFLLSKLRLCNFPLPTTIFTNLSPLSVERYCCTILFSNKSVVKDRSKFINNQPCLLEKRLNTCIWVS